MNYLYPKNKYKEIPQHPKHPQIYNMQLQQQQQQQKPHSIIENNFQDIQIDSKIDYNKIYYSEQNKKKLCYNDQANVPCDIVKICNDNPDANTLSDSELAFFYKVAYEEAAREIFMRTLNELESK